jgi:uncharacterized membrane protein
VGVRIQSWWFQLRGSLWFVPALLTAGAALLALLTVEIDLRLRLDRQAGTDWLFGGGAEGARGVLSAIAGTMITVTALVFSITVVALQLAASQLTPRVLRTFMSDRGNQVVLGFFIGTFTYALLVLRSVRAPLEQRGGFVPAISVSVAIVLALVCVGLLIYFIHHGANSMRVSVVVDRVAAMTLGLVDELYPEERQGRTTTLADPMVPDESLVPVHAGAAGYLQALDEEALVALARERAMTIRIEPCVGDFVLQGSQIASVLPAVDPDSEDAIRDALRLGFERTAQADVEFGIVQISDIAVKALSPGINDPNTAMTCTDRLAELLVTVAGRLPAGDLRVRAEGDGRLLLPGPSFDRLVAVAFGRIRHYAAEDARSIEHLATTLGRMAHLVPPACRPPLAREARLALDEARTSISVEADVERVERAAAWALRSADAPVSPEPAATR